jgi:DNA-binding response OmpR family regulator
MSHGSGEEGAMKLLLIEDDEHVAHVLAEAFASQGHATAIRYTGEDGLAYLTRERPDAVMLDVRLPRLDGVAVLRQIRATDPTLPVIIMTGLATPGEIAEVRRLGVTEIIEKPEVLRHFSDALARITSRDRLQDAT